MCIADDLSESLWSKSALNSALTEDGSASVSMRHAFVAFKGECPNVFAHL